MMKRVLLVLICLIALNSNVLIADEVLTDLIWTLSNHKDPEVRKNAAAMLGTLKVKESVKSLIDALSDDNEDVRQACLKALVRITKQNLPLEQTQWLNWWEKEGQILYESASYNTQEIAKLKSYLDIAFVIMLLELVFILLFIVVFSFMGGAKIKEMKEINRRAEQYISNAETVSKRFDGLFEEIEKRREELVQFFSKIREDNQHEIERFSDSVQQNVEHHLREASRSLREKSESELKQTLSLLKEDLDHTIKKTVTEQIAKSVEQRAKSVE